MQSSKWKSRRQVLELGAAVGLTATGAVELFKSEPGFAQTAAPAASVSTADLMAPGPLPDLWQGSADAPITMIEYASMTCPHCAAFTAETYPALKSKYIDTGKVHFVLREFPFDPYATAAFMLARCVGPDKREAMVELLFAQQKNWAYADKPLEGLTNVVKQTGMTQDQFNACLRDRTLYDQVNEIRDTAAKKFGVEATPTFFVNGKKIEGEMSVAELDNLLAPMLKS
jgi:protein-disulfide isomerase